MNVCVIGAGPSGLTTVKQLLDEGHAVQCYERGDDIGGIWQRSRDPEADAETMAKEIGCLMPLSKLIFRPRLLVRHWFYPYNQACCRLTVSAIRLLPLLFLPRSVHPKYVLFRGPRGGRAGPAGIRSAFGPKNTYST